MVEGTTEGEPEGGSVTSTPEGSETVSNNRTHKEDSSASPTPEDKTLLGRFLLGHGLGNRIHSPNFAKIVKLIIVALLPFLGYLFLNWVGLFVALIIVMIFFRNLLGGKIIPVTIIIIIAIISLIMLEPLPKYWFFGIGSTSPLRGATFGSKTKKETQQVNTGILQLIQQTQASFQKQIQCAEGMCPEGETEGPQIGMTLSSPQLLYQQKPLIGEKIYFSSVIQGYNLNVYPDVVVYPSCRISHAKADVIPESIPFPDISNYQAVVRCSGITQPDTYFMNTLNVSLDFNFTTESDLRLFVMDDETRNSLMMTFGNDFMSKLFGIQGEPIAKYNDGPINLGMRVTQYPIAARSDESAALVFALANQWKALNGKLVNITSMKIVVPEGIEIIPEEGVCPFEKKDADTYVLNNDFELNEPVTGVLNFFCGIKVNDKKTDFPVWIPHVKVVANYKYRLTATNDIYVYKKKGDNSGGTTGGSGTGDTGSNTGAPVSLSKDCSSYTPTGSNPPSNYILAYEKGKFSSQIKSGLQNVIPQYNLPGFSDLDMRALLLSIMCKETSMGTMGDDDGDGIPDHIAGCDVKNYDYPKDNIQENILCAARTLNNWYNKGICSSPDSEGNVYHLDRFDCMIWIYNQGPGTKDKPSANNVLYRNQVKSFMEEWKNYICSKETG